MILISFLSSCKKNCETSNLGYIDIVNNSSYPYTVYIDGKIEGVLDGHKYWNDHEVFSGDHSIRYVQNSGYILYATDRTESVNVVQCGNTSFSFP